MQFITLQTFKDLSQAILVKSVLEAHQIEAQLPEEHAGTMQSHFMEYRVLVNEKDFEKARNVLNDYLKSIQQEPPQVKQNDPHDPYRLALYNAIMAYLFLPVLANIISLKILLEKKHKINRSYILAWILNILFVFVAGYLLYQYLQDHLN